MITMRCKQSYNRLSQKVYKCFAYLDLHANREVLVKLKVQVHSE